MPEHLRGLEVYDQLKFRRLLYGQVCGFLALENSSGVYADLSIALYKARTIAHQSASLGEIPPEVHCWN